MSITRATTRGQSTIPGGCTYCRYWRHSALRAPDRSFWSAHARVLEAHTEVTVTVKGVKHYFDLVVEPLRDLKGRLLGLLCSAIETTYLKETIIRLQNALNDVQLLKGTATDLRSCKTN